MNRTDKIVAAIGGAVVFAAVAVCAWLPYHPWGGV
jgi:hypothetical protein